MVCLSVCVNEQACENAPVECGCKCVNLLYTHICVIYISYPVSQGMYYPLLVTFTVTTICFQQVASQNWSLSCDTIDIKISGFGGWTFV